MLQLCCFLLFFCCCVVSSSKRQSYLFDSDKLRREKKLLNKITHRRKFLKIFRSFALSFLPVSRKIHSCIYFFCCYCCCLSVTFFPLYLCDGSENCTGIVLSACVIMITKLDEQTKVQSKFVFFFIFVICFLFLALFLSVDIQFVWIFFRFVLCICE